MKSCPQENDRISAAFVDIGLKSSLRVCVGNSFIFRVEGGGSQALSKLQVKLDPNGQFWLESDSGARVAFSLHDELLAFYSRQGPADLFLDAFILAFSSTPLVEGKLSWQDMLPGRLLPRPWFVRLAHAILNPFSPCGRSQFKRCYDPFLRLWKQEAEHRVGLWSCSTEAEICQDRGLRTFTLRLGGREILKADLLELGVGKDNGIPEWTMGSVASV